MPRIPTADRAARPASKRAPTRRLARGFARIASLALASLVAAVAPPHDRCLAAQDVPAARSIDDGDRLASEGKYLAALIAKERALESRPRDPQLLNMVATLRSFLGDEAGACAAMEALGGGGRGAAPSAALARELASCTPVDALEEIARQAATRRIVILNEAHHVARHRAFALALAERLHALGYRYLACETFTADAGELRRRGHPTEATGYYTREPFFAEFVRAAVALGFEPIHYEIERSSAPPTDVAASIRERETAQCANLVLRLFARDPAAKAFIYCGYSHATEEWTARADGDDDGWMAARLGRALGLDPLTIDQTEQTPGSTPERSGAAWTFAERRGWLARPVLLRRADGGWFVGGDGWAGKVDLQLFHPALAPVDGRPGWMAGSGGRVAAEIPVELEPREGRSMVEARRADDPPTALAVDRLVLEAGEPCPMLLLPPGRYRLVAQDERGASVAEAAIEVTAR
ncbi:MAG: hypothetical protein JNL90_07755 [Planctomycetes bacterium]|nr:hypothetical protein [Planctomycetota bacterium]